MEVGRRSRRDRAKMCPQAQTRVFKKLQVVSYLSSNVHLHHPHYIQLTLPAHHHEATYFNLGSNFYTNRRISATKQPIGGREMRGGRRVPDENGEDDDEKATHTTCSRGVSTDEIEDDEELKPTKRPQKNSCSPHSELNLDSNSLSSPPSTTSSTPSDIPNGESKRFEDGDPIGNEPMLSRNSMLFSLIACGGPGSFRKTVPAASLPPPPGAAGRKSCSGSSLHKGVVCKAAAVAAAEEDRLMINYMSENPRFGNLQAEEKEYFSGSIVDSIANDHERITANQPVLKKSSSYNQERCGKAGIGEEEGEEVKKEKGDVALSVLFDASFVKIGLNLNFYISPCVHNCVFSLTKTRRSDVRK